MLRERIESVHRAVLPAYSCSEHFAAGAIAVNEFISRIRPVVIIASMSLVVFGTTVIIVKLVRRCYARHHFEEAAE